MTHDDADILRQAYDAFRTQDMATLETLVSPRVRWHEAGLEQPIEGREALAARFATASGLVSEIDLHDVVAGDEHCVALVTAHLRKPDGDHVTYRAVEVVHVEDGMITERWAYMDAVPAEVQEFFAGIG